MHFHLQKNKKSFTLVELILALGIFSIVILSLYGTFWAAMKINQRSQRMNQYQSQTISALQQMAQEIEQVVFYSSKEVNAFKGGHTEISFLVSTAKGLKRIGYFLTPAEETQVYRLMIGEHSSKNLPFVLQHRERQERYALVRQESSFLRSETTDQEVFSLDMAEQGLKFFYAYLEGTPEAWVMVWRDHWDQDYLPAGIKIQCTFLDPESPEGTRQLEKFIYIPTGFWGHNEV